MLTELSDPRRRGNGNALGYLRLRLSIRVCELVRVGRFGHSLLAFGHVQPNGFVYEIGCALGMSQGLLSLVPVSPGALLHLPK